MSTPFDIKTFNYTLQLYKETYADAFYGSDDVIEKLVLKDLNYNYNDFLKFKRNQYFGNDEEKKEIDKNSMQYRLKRKLLIKKLQKMKILDEHGKRIKNNL